MADRDRSQSYATHRRYDVFFHFIGLPILTTNVVVKIVQASRFPSLATIWEILVAVALLIAIVLTRVYAVKVQNRVIRMEERARLERLLPEDLRAHIPELRTKQLIALRFSPDEELPQMVRSIVAGELTGADEIKRGIRNWRADWLRV